MSIRPAKASDVMALIRLLESAHAKSRYSSMGNIDRDAARQLFARSVHMHGHKSAGATLFMVAENEGQIEGYGLFYIDRVYQVGDKLGASDVHFYCTERAEHGDARAMLDAFFEWAESNPKVIEMSLCDSDVMGEPSAGLGRIVNKRGFETAGTVYRRSIAR